MAAVEQALWGCDVARGVVEAYDALLHAVDVRLDGGTGRLAGVPVLRVGQAAPLAPGDRVLVAIWRDVGAVVLGAYAA